MSYEGLEYRQGYAVSVELLKWYKHGEEPTFFEKIHPHYVGCFTKEEAEIVFESLSDQLRVELEKHNEKMS